MKKITQREIVKSLIDGGETLNCVNAYTEYKIKSLAAIVSKLNKSGEGIESFVNDEPNYDGVVIPYKYYFKGVLIPTPPKWPTKQTTFRIQQGESKTDAIIRFMEEYGFITTTLGYTELFSFRIGAVIHSLRKQDYNIKTIRMKGRHGEAMYKLISSPVK